MSKYNKEHILYAAIGILIIAVLYLYFHQPSTRNEEQLTFQSLSEEGKTQTNGKTTTSKPVTTPEDTEDKGNDAKQQVVIYLIDVKGAVKQPGVYRVNQGDRVIDVIRKAGGFMAGADQTKINLAQMLEDEMVIYVPKQGEKVSPVLQSGSPSESDGAEEGTAKININTASESELEALPGIGPTKAAAITAYRQAHGEFKSVDELLNVSGIGEKSLEQMKPSITLK